MKLAGEPISVYFYSPMLKQLFQLSKYPALDSPTLRSNLRAHIADGALYGLALSFISYNTILPVFVQQVGGSVVAIGSVPVLWTIGMNFPQAIVVRFTDPVRQVKPRVLGFGLLARHFFLAVGLFTFLFVKSLPVSTSVPLLLTLIFLTAVAGSFGGPSWFHLYTMTTPMKLRGRLLAIRQVLSSSLGIVGGSLVTFILSTVAFPGNFGLLFFIAYLFSMGSYLYLRKLIEPPSDSVYPVNEYPSSGLKDMERILKGNKNFRNFLIADAFTLMSMSAAAFYAVYAIEKFDVSASYAGTFTAIVMAGMLAGNSVFGYLADALGHKVTLIALALSSAAASLIAVIAGNILVYGFAFFFMSWTVSLQVISRLSFVVELCPENERPTYVALTNTITAPTAAVGILFGWIARVDGFPVMFDAAAFTGLAAAAWLHFYVHDPRFEERPKTTVARSL
ncbi:MAG TPA: MFS transporter [Bacteroidota bacterium]|nr:MFS transporter [Bacteroidota bacterium]